MAKVKKQLVVLFLVGGAVDVVMGPFDTIVTAKGAVARALRNFLGEEDLGHGPGADADVVWLSENTASALGGQCDIRITDLMPPPVPKAKGKKQGTNAERLAARAIMRVDD